jgi:N-acyl homoserine lactone hydrolase
LRPLGPARYVGGSTLGFRPWRTATAQGMLRPFTSRFCTMLSKAVPFALLLLVACEATLPPAPEHARVAPNPKGTPLRLCWLEYSHAENPAGYGLAGPSARAHWNTTASGLLIRHPQGHLLVDLGNSTHFDEEIQGAGLVARQYLKLGPGSVRTQKTAVQAMAEVGEQPSQLRALVISHIHADHAGGLVDLPQVPVITTEEELAFAKERKDSGSFAVVRSHAEALIARAQPLSFADVPYENFQASVDYFGDGSVVFVRLFGHTPGSLGTFVNRSAQSRLFHVGDATNSTEAIERRVGKSFALDWTDHDPALADGLLAKLSQLHVQDPQLAFLPAHDRDAWSAVFPGGPGTCVGP